MIEDHKRPNRTYTMAERTEAVGLALAVGPLKAGEQLGIPGRTVASWANGERQAPEVRAVILSSRQALADRMNEILSVASEQVLAGLRDPKQRLGDRVRALEVALDAARILGADMPDTGLSDDEALQLEDWLRVHASEIAAAESEVAALPEMAPGPIEEDAGNG